MDDQRVTHTRILNIKLRVAPFANHRLIGAVEKKGEPLLVPAEAVAWVQALRKGGREIQGIELCGPGDVLASPSTTLACLELLQPEIQDAELSLTALGLGGAEVASDLARLGVRRVNLLVDTVEIKTAMKRYVWIRPGKKTVPLARAAEMLIAGQAEAVQALQGAGIRVVIRSTLIPGINDTEVSALAEKMALLGAVGMELDGEEGTDLEEARSHALKYLPTTVYHPGPELQPPGRPRSCEGIAMPEPAGGRDKVAVVSSNGLEVDMHLGQASQLLIYGAGDDGLASLLEVRKTPEGDGGAGRWQRLAGECLHDCFSLLASHAGGAPRTELAALGIQVILTEDNIEGLVDLLYGGGRKKKCK